MKTNKDGSVSFVYQGFDIDLYPKDEPRINECAFLEFDELVIDLFKTKRGRTLLVKAINLMDHPRKM